MEKERNFWIKEGIKDARKEHPKLWVPMDELKMQDVNEKLYVEAFKKETLKRLILEGPK